MDLAGSERTSKMECNSDADFKESCHINSSLLHLGRCLKELKDCHSTLNARTSLLTMILLNYLNQSNNVAMVSNISKDYPNFEETVKVLQYASDSNRIVMPKVKTGLILTPAMSSRKIIDNKFDIETPNKIVPFQNSSISVIVEKVKKQCELQEFETKCKRLKDNLLQQAASLRRETTVPRISYFSNEPLLDSTQKAFVKFKLREPYLDKENVAPENQRSTQDFATLNTKPKNSIRNSFPHFD